MLLQTLLAKLQTKFPGLSKEFLTFLAGQMVAGISDESGIDDAVTALDNAPIKIPTLAAEFQKEGDKRVTAAKKKWDSENGKPGQKPESDNPDNKPAEGNKSNDADTPAWAKALIQSNAELKQELATIKKEKTTGSMKDRLAKAFPNVPEKVRNRMALPEKEEDFESFLEEMKEVFSDYVVPASGNEGGVTVRRPASGTPVAGSGSTKVDPELIALAKQMNEPAKANNQKK